jgi:hypothetical protein
VTFAFAGLPAGPADLDVDVTGHRGPVTVVVDGVIVGVLDPGSVAGRFALPAVGVPRTRVDLQTDTFRSGDGRDLGALLGRVTLRPRIRGWWPGWAAAVALVVPAMILAAAGLSAGLAPRWSALAAAVASALQALALAPCGLVHSPYALRLGLLVSIGVVLALAFARALRDAPAAPLAFIAFLVAFAVHVVLGTSPMVVSSDTMLHAHKLVAVAAGDLFPTSLTQHARQFRFPYGVSFYAVLAPLERAGFDPVALVRGGAAAAGLAAQAALFALVLARTEPLAAFGAAVVLALMPGTFDVAYSHGNLSNAFGQSATIGFFAWWASSAPGGWPVGAALFVLGALAHFSSLIVLLVLAACLLLVRGRGADRRRLLAVLVGLALAAVYYAHFAGLVASQLPRLLEGGGQGRGSSQGAWDALWLQVFAAVGRPWHPLETPGQWGIPALVLAWIGRPRPRANLFDRDLAAWWIAGGVLAVPAILSPLEVRYIYALGAVVAVAAGMGLARLARKGGGSAWIGWALLAAQTVVGGAAVVEALLRRYRT